MEKKIAIMFADGEAKRVKFVFGDTVKSIRLDDLGSAASREFLDKLFEHYQVCLVESLQLVNRNSIGAAPGAAVAVGAPARPPAPPQSALARQLAEDHGQWIKSNSRTMLIIDDLYTGEEIPNAPGCKKAVAIGPGRALDLSTLDPENVKKSSILRRLIQGQTLAFCPAAEAISIEEQHGQREAEEQRAEAAREKAAPGVLPAGMSARELAARGLQGDVAAEVDLGAEPVGQGGGMEELLAQVGGAQEEDAEERPKSQIAARPPVNVTSESRPISRK